MAGVFDFLNQRKKFASEYFACPGSTKTVLISSYIWWTELMAYALLKLGYNVLVAEPWYAMWLDDQRWANFDSIYQQWVDIVRRMNVQLVIGGNSTILVPHPKTKELLHRTAGVPAVSYWWDEPRNMPPMTRRGLTAEDHLASLKDDRTLNIFWDIDIAEEMQKFYGVGGAHVPLGATPEFWQNDHVPLSRRSMKLCFLGNNHDEGNWEQSCDPAVLAWAKKVAAIKLANLDLPMVQCIERVGFPLGETSGYSVALDLKQEFARWNILGAALLTDCRNRIVTAAAKKLGKEFILIGKGWERFGLTTYKEHSGVPAAKEYYASSQASLNLFGGCVHGGMPLRPYEIAASNGLLFTQYNRELPSLFEPGRECVAFRDVGEMEALLDRILSDPGAYEKVAEAGKRRALAEHTWEKRMEKVMSLAKEKFSLPW